MRYDFIMCKLFQLSPIITITIPFSPSPPTLSTAPLTLIFQFQTIKIHLSYYQRPWKNIVMYPIINLRRYKMDLHWYLRTLEEVVIRVLSKTFSIQASPVEDLTGVWVGNEKLAAVGIRVDQWITYHGLALNVTTDLTPFNWIVPCGVRGRQVGSIKGLLSTQSGITHETADIHSLEDASLIHLTHKSLIEEFSQRFHLEYHYETISVRSLYENKRSSLPKERLQS